MPRANRHFVPNHIWHITHRCHKRDFLLKFERDRRRWRYWLFKARQRHRLCVLNYIVTCNHIHLLVRDRGEGEIAKSLQLIAGRTAQGFNRRKGRKGAFWEDRYHATAVDMEGHLARCMTYIDLNMVRAGVVAHPMKWTMCGYREIQRPRARYGVVNIRALLEIFELQGVEELQSLRRLQVAETLGQRSMARENMWSECLAVGRRQYVESFKDQLGVKGAYAKLTQAGNTYMLKDQVSSYRSGSFLAPKQSV